MEQKNNSFLYLALTVAVLIIGSYLIFQNLKIPVQLPKNLQVLNEKNEEIPKFNVWEGDLPPLGNPQAPVKVIEFGDFHCPFCVITAVQFYPELEKYINNGQVVFYFRDFPLSQLHPQAFLVHLASRCANDQDKYWEFHKRVFNDYYQKLMVNKEPGFTTGDQNYLINLAKELNLNVQEFTQCLNSQKHKDKIERDIRDGNNLGVNGTPTFFVNGEMIVGADFQGLKIKIEKYLK